eukprot:gene26614-67316_t
MVGVGAKVRELLDWLNNWDRNHARVGAASRMALATGGKRAAAAAMNADTWNTPLPSPCRICRAALISGSPGIGKTTAAHLVCKQCGFDYVEFNASDHRSAKTLREK